MKYRACKFIKIRSSSDLKNNHRLQDCETYTRKETTSHKVFLDTSKEHIKLLAPQNAYDYRKYTENQMKTLGKSLIRFHNTLTFVINSMNLKPNVDLSVHNKINIFNYKNFSPFHVVQTGSGAHPASP
jgi:hypothetical protein